MNDLDPNFNIFDSIMPSRQRENVKIEPFSQNEKGELTVHPEFLEHVARIKHGFDDLISGRAKRIFSDYSTPEDIAAYLDDLLGAGVFPEAFKNPELRALKGFSSGFDNYFESHFQVPSPEPTGCDCGNSDCTDDN